MKTRPVRQSLACAAGIGFALWLLPGLAAAEDQPSSAAEQTIVPAGETIATKPAPSPRAPRGRNQIEEIIVTSERREASVQDVVGGIQAFSGAALDAAGAGGFQDYLTQVPGAGFRQDGSGNTKIGLRGVSNISGNQLGTFSGASPVGVYLNDVPIQGSGQLPDLDLYDLQRIEVLKGPQGTLYGEGAMGGAIRMIVNEASLAETDFKAESGSSYTEDGGSNQVFKLAGGTPIIRDTLGLRVVATAKRDSGFIDLPNQNRPDANSTAAQSARLIADYRPLEKLGVEFLYLKDHNHLHGSPNVLPATEQQLSNDIYEPEMSISNFDLGGLSLKYDFDAFQVSSVTSLLFAKHHAVFRLPLLKSTVQGNVETVLVGPLGLVLPPSLVTGLVFDVAQIRQEPFDDRTRDRGISQELRLVSSGERRLSYIGGLYYQARRQHYDQTSYVEQSPVPGEDRQLHRDGVQPEEQISIYGEATYKLLPDLALTLGLRAFHETIAIHDFFQTYGATALIQATSLDQNPKMLDVKGSYNDLLPKASLSWQLSEDHLLYALASRGYRTTTPNVQAQLGVGPPLLQPDFLWNYEVGLKSQWLDHRLTVNASAYYIDWKNLQASRLGGGHLGLLPVNIIYIDNIGDAVIKGGELEVNAALGEGFRVLVTGGYQDGRIVKVDGGSVATAGSRTPNSPRWTGSGTVSYTQEISDSLILSLSSTYQFVDDQATVEVTDSDPSGSETKAYRKLGALVSLDSGHWGLSLFGDNLLNNLIELQNQALVATEHFTTLGRPRTVGLRLRATFWR